MGFYSKFSGQDLIESYKNQLDYQGEASQELLDEIERRGSLESFKAEINNQAIRLNECNRIIKEIHNHYRLKTPKDEVSITIESNIFSQKEIEIIVNEKYDIIHKTTENLNTDHETILKSFIGLMISPIVSSIFIFILLICIKQLIVFHFFLLIPAYIINYLIINKITGKTRSNLAVFIATFIATVINLLIFVMLII